MRLSRIEKSQLTQGRADFESRVDDLAMLQARRVVARGVGLMMAFPSVDPSGQPGIAVLNRMW